MKIIENKQSGEKLVIQANIHMARTERLGNVLEGDNLVFFQAEDSIRNLVVTEVQTCALPICHNNAYDDGDDASDGCGGGDDVDANDGELVDENKQIPRTKVGAKWKTSILISGSTRIMLWAWRKMTNNKIKQKNSLMTSRSEERRIGKACKSRWSPQH